MLSPSAPINFIRIDPSFPLLIKIFPNPSVQRKPKDNLVCVDNCQSMLGKNIIEKNVAKHFFIKPKYWHEEKGL